MQYIDNISINKELKELYLKGKYKNFRSHLVKNKQSIKPSKFYFNLGTIDLKLKNYGYAKFHLENSVLKGRLSADVFHNLKVVNQYVETPTVDFQTDLVYNSKILPLQTWLIITLFFLILTSLLFKLKKIKKISMIILLSCLSVTPLCFKYFYLDNKNIAIALEKTNFQEGPTKLFKRIGSVPEGAKLLLGKRNGNWWFIVKPINYNGWINGKKLGFL